MTTLTQKRRAIPNAFSRGRGCRTKYTYDALGRRIRKTVSNGGLTADIPDGTTDYLYSGVQCVEERNPFGGEQEDEDTPLRQYVWGRYVDELIQQRDIEGQEYADYYLLSDLLYRSVALTDVVKAIQEAYDTDAYGNTLIFDQPGTAGNWFASNAHRTNVPKCRFIFTGREYDAETQVYFYRARYYQQVLGRFTSRDPLLFSQGTNVYEYVTSRPVAFYDSSGLARVTVQDLPGWYEERGLRARGQIRYASTVRGTCQCSATPPREWEMVDVQALIMVAITLNPRLLRGVDAAGQQVTQDRVFGHEQMHQRKVVAAVESVKGDIQIVLEKAEQIDFHTQGDCEVYLARRLRPQVRDIVNSAAGRAAVHSGDAPW